MQHPEVILIKGADGNPIRINKADYDPEAHDLHDGGAPFVPASNQTAIDAMIAAAGNFPALQADLTNTAATIDLNNGPTTILYPVPVPLEGPDAPPIPAAPAGRLAPVSPVPATQVAAAPLPPVGAAAPARQPMQIGSKWFICDPAGNKLMEKSFQTREQAEAAING